jgi:hypothetical protein
MMARASVLSTQMLRDSAADETLRTTRRRDRPKNPLRVNGDLVSHFNVIWVVQSRLQKYSA